MGQDFELSGLCGLENVLSTALEESVDLHFLEDERELCFRRYAGIIKELPSLIGNIFLFPFNS